MIARRMLADSVSVSLDAAVRHHLNPLVYVQRYGVNGRDLLISLVVKLC